MERNSNLMSCDMSGIKPAMLELRYPPIQVERRNPDYAAILSFDYCGPVSELSAIAQYEAHIRKIKDECVDAVLRRIIRDEEYHIMLLQGLMAEL